MLEGCAQKAHGRERHGAGAVKVCVKCKRTLMSVLLHKMEDRVWCNVRGVGCVYTMRKGREEELRIFFRPEHRWSSTEAE